MSESATQARPRQLTTAAGFVIGGSVLLVLAVFDAMANLESVDTRDAVSAAVGSADGLRMSVDGVLAVMRVGLFVAAASAVSAVVLGIFVLQRHRAARTLLSVLAVPILVTAPLTGTFLGALVAFSIAMLWSGPARDWYAGRPVREPVRQPVQEPVQHVRQVEQPPAHDADRVPGEDDQAPALSTGATSTEPRPTSGYGQSRTVASSYPTYQDPRWETPPAHAPVPQGTHPHPVPMPSAVRIACIATWVFSAGVAIVCVMALLVAAGDSDVYLRELQRNPTLRDAQITPDALLVVLWVVGLAMIAWAGAASVLALFVWRRHDWARYLLVVSAAAVFVASVFAFPVGLVLQAACVAVIVMLVGRPSREWFSSRRPQRQVW
jgi:hypothetical protein